MPSVPHRAALAVLALLLASARAGASQPLGLDLDGHPIVRLAGPGTRVVVLVFAASDCPISNRYVPEVGRLSRLFAGQGVRFWWVFPNPADTAPVVSAHMRDFAIADAPVLDVRQALVRWAHVRVTPEAAVFLVRGDTLREVFHGRIDDRFLAFGRERPAPGRHELQAAIASALDGSAVAPPRGPAVGCAIVPRQP